MRHLVRPHNLWHYKTIMSIDGTKKSRKGRPPVDTEAVNLRLPREMIVAIDALRRGHDDPPTRPELIRTILLDWMTTNGYIPKD